MKDKTPIVSTKSTSGDLGVTIFLYDGTFEGLLTAVFDAYARKQFPQELTVEKKPLLFTDTYTVVTDTEKSDRVLQGLQKRLSKYAMEMLFTCFLSEQEEVANAIFRYACKTFAAQKSIELNFADPDVLLLSQIYKKVKREAQLMQQFVRFQKTADGIFFSYIEPRYNVLPCVADFFEDRFADQQWIIYDAKRKYALYYDLQKTEIVNFEQLGVNSETGELSAEQSANDELDFQHLWKEYLQSVTIRQRINPQLQRQHMPRRFWKYLPEKRK